MIREIKFYDLTKQEEDRVRDAEMRQMRNDISKIDKNVLGLRRQVFLLNEDVQEMKGL